MNSPIRRIPLFAITALLVATSVPHPFAPIMTSVSAEEPVRLSERKYKELLKRINQKAERFQISLAKALTKTSFRESDSEADFTQYSEDFMLLIGQLDQSNLAPRHVVEILRTASAIERLLLCEDISSQVIVDWTILHADLDLLAKIYGLKWSEVVVTRELVAQLEKDAHSLAEQLNQPSTSPPEFVQTASSMDRLRLSEDLRKTATALTTVDADSTQTYARIGEFNNRLHMFGDYIKDHSVGSQLRRDWLGLSAQVEEILRLYNLDGRGQKPVAPDLVKTR